MERALMDEITMFASIRPEPPADQDALQKAARAAFITAVRPRITAVRPRARWRLPAGLGALAAASATAAMAIVATTSGAPASTNVVVTAAWTVHEDAGGTVTLQIRQLANPAKLQRTLRADGIYAIVKPLAMKEAKLKGTTYYYPACRYSQSEFAARSVQGAVVTNDLPAGWIIHPSAMPRGSALFITSDVDRTGQSAVFATSVPIVLTKRTGPACVPVSPPLPPGR